MSDGGKASPYRGPIIDTHVHPMLPGESPITGVPHAASDYLRQISGADVRFAAALVMAPRGDLARTRALNDKVLDLSREPGSRFFTVCSVHPSDGADALAEIDRVAKEGAKGLKLHPNTQSFDVSEPVVRDVVARATEHRLPVLFDAYSPFDADQPGKFVRLAMEVPEGRIILPHAHGPRFADLLVYEILARYPWWKRNVWVDLSATGLLLAGGPFAAQFAWVCRKVGIDRLLFGSDYPLDDPSTAIASMTTYGFSPEELSSIFHDNGARLFDLPPGAPLP
ncbi:MAG TPA: amidohydrolase family protein [Thermoplasmata archaeon]|nr:amidohydrolase family protein [Thermoplasmata archaeon]